MDFFITLIKLMVFRECQLIYYSNMNIRVLTKGTRLSHRFKFLERSGKEIRWVVNGYTMSLKEEWISRFRSFRIRKLLVGKGE